MDTQGKPTFQRGACPTCKEWNERDEITRAAGQRPDCQSCGKPIEVYRIGGQNGVVPAGFDSHTIHHWHFDTVSGVQGLRAVKARVCKACVAKDFEEVYGKEWKEPEVAQPLGY